MARKPLGSILAVMAALGSVFAGPSWDAWRAVLKAIFALPMTAFSVVQRISAVAASSVRTTDVSGSVMNCWSTGFACCSI
jgi:hypothetical protein